VIVLQACGRDVSRFSLSHGLGSCAQGRVSLEVASQLHSQHRAAPWYKQQRLPFMFDMSASIGASVCSCCFRVQAGGG
jgi:hypothetical protein